MSTIHLLAGMFKPDAAPRTVYIREIKRGCRRADVQLMLKYRGFPVCTLYWEDNDVNSIDTFHSGWCLVEFLDKSTADRACNRLRGYEFQGRNLHVRHCDAKRIPRQEKDPLQEDVRAIIVKRVATSIPLPEFQSMLSILGFDDFVFSHSAANIREGDYHRGWLWIKFTDAQTANRARACLEGINLRGHALITKSCANTDERPSENKPDAKPLTMPTLAQLLELPAPTRTRYISRSTQTDSNDMQGFRDQQSETQVVLNGDEDGENEKRVAGQAQLKDSRERNGEEQDGKQASINEAMNPADHVVSGEDLISFDSPEPRYCEVSHDWW